MKITRRKFLKQASLAGFTATTIGPIAAYSKIESNTETPSTPEINPATKPELDPAVKKRTGPHGEGLPISNSRL